MRRVVLAAIAAVLVLAGLAATAEAKLTKPYLVGAASRSINPDPDGTFAGKPVYLGGYGIGGGSPVFAGRPATGVLGEGLSVDAFAVSDGRTPFVIADVEAQGWFVALKNGPYGLLDMRKEVERRTGGALPAENVVIQSNHSHSGPDPLGVWGGVPEEYLQYVTNRTVEAIVAAYGSMVPATLYYGTADGRDLLSNQFDYDEANKAVDSDVRVLCAGREPRSPVASDARAGAAAALAGGEARGAGPGRRLRGLAERDSSRRPSSSVRPDALERRGAVGEHRVLREAGERLGDLEGALEVAAGRDDLGHAARCASASSASTMRPVRIMSSARPRPTMRGSRWVPPSISGTPKRRSVKPSGVLGGDAQVAPQRQLEAAGQAPARDRGDRRLGRDEAREAERPVGERRAAGRSVSIALRSAPAQNARSPAPVSTSTRASSSASKRR